LRRYIEIKQSDLPSAVAAKKTREFRCPPREQVSIFIFAVFGAFLSFYDAVLGYIKQARNADH
jgi:hypothetical protein